jgi:hypothetical protein
MELKGYTNIPDWMLSLDLDVYETIILAVIYGFSQDGESTFAGSLKYLCQKAKCSRRKVTMALPNLVEKGLIIKIDKEVRGVHLCEYKVSPTCMGSASDAPGGSACHAPNNIENINIDNNSLYKSGSSRFQKPTIEEIRQYCQESRLDVDAEQFFLFYESKGWMVGKNKMKDWKACVRTWEKSSSQKKSDIIETKNVDDKLRDLEDYFLNEINGG